MKIKQTTIYSTTLAFVIFGFYFQSSFFDVIGGTNSITSIVYRAAIICSVLVLIIFGKLEKICKISMALFFSFFIVYFYSLSRSILFEGESLAFDSSYYFLMLFGGVIIPSAFFLGVNYLDIKHFKVIARKLLFFTCLFVCVKYYFFSANTVGVRLESESVSPIIIGHVALSLLILTISDLKKTQYISYVIIFFCIALIFLSQSRSAFIASAVVLALYFIRKISVKTMLIYCGIGVVTAIAILPLIKTINSASNSEFDTFRYVRVIGSSEDLSSMSRFISFKGAWNQFENSPILGDHVEERTTKYYPHNILLEALMSTGIVGTIPLVILFLLTIYRAQNLLIKNNEGIVFALLFYQYITLAMFSSSIYLNTQLWYFVFGVNAVYMRSLGSTFDNKCDIHKKV